MIGASCVDLLLSEVDRDRFFSGSCKVKNITTSFGGDALNEALVLKRLGNDVSLKTILGNDFYGRMIKEHLIMERIGFDCGILKDGIETYISIVLMDKDGSHCFVGNENGSLRLLKNEDIVIDDDCEIVSFASLFISKMIDEKGYEDLFSSIKARNILLCVDSSHPKNREMAIDLDYLKYIDYFFCNEKESQDLCDNSDIFECEKILYSKGIGNVIIKLGERGCLYKGKIFSPVKKIKCIDTTGAGDSFQASFISALMMGYPVEECIGYANLCAGKACEYIGSVKWLDLL